MSDSRTPSLTSSRPATPSPPFQPDHFYGTDSSLLQSSSSGKNWLDPQDDPFAQRGIPVFKPNWDEFQDFEDFMNKIECWGMRSGIVKIVPPKEWTDALPSFKQNLASVKVKNPIEQHMVGRAGLFRQQNVEKRRTMSVREWAELCNQEDFRAPGVDGVGPYHARHTSHKDRASRKVKPKSQLAERAAQDAAFLADFDLARHWLPPNTSASDYTPEFCKELERQYWRNCGLSKPAWYGADMQGTLFGDTKACWNVGHLPSALSRLLPTSNKGLPGVNTPYLYFGMWRATFAWHVEDMDLFSINYIHFGAPKFWYAIPQGKANTLEQTFRGYFPKDASTCPQFLRHKSFFASPNVLSQSSCRPNTLVQHAGEFVVTYPRGYHAGFNLGLNCAESVNFALDSWLDLGRNAKVCECVDFSVRIDVDQLLRDRELEHFETKVQRSREGQPNSRKRKSEDLGTSLKAKKTKRAKDGKAISPMLPSKAGGAKTTVTLKLGPKPKEPEDFPCCLCVSMSREGLLPLYDSLADAPRGDRGMAHEQCANIVPETWVDEYEIDELTAEGTRRKIRAVFGVDGIVKDRWNLKCSACPKAKQKAHGAPIQCTKGKCSKAFHVSCARDSADHGIVYEVLREVEKDVILLQPTSDTITDVKRQSMSTEGLAGSPHVLKVIRKVEVQVLCSQHNPAIAEAKKAQKQDKIRSELLLLPAMSRIKIRVSAGVFEVSLLRVIDETKSVEVLWDRGVKREFKWGSVVFGNTEGQTIGQKPAELSTDAASLASQSVMTFPASSGSASKLQITQNQNSVPSGSYLTNQHAAVPCAVQATTSSYPAGAYDYPCHPRVDQLPAQYSSSYPYTDPTQQGIYQHADASQHHIGYHANQYRPHLQWQQPYRGPPPASSTQYRVGQVASEGAALSGTVYFSQPPQMENVV